VTPEVSEVRMPPAESMNRRIPSHENEPRRRRGFVSEPLGRVEQESLEHVVASRRADWQVIIVLLTTAVTLTLQEYLFTSAQLDFFCRVLDLAGLGPPIGWLTQLTGTTGNQRLAGLILWAVGALITYVVLPGLVIRLVLRQRLRDFGLNVRGILGSSWIYLLMFLFMIPFLFYFSHTRRFQATYPFYDLRPGEPLWPAFWIWEAFYCMQFVSLEFFFRGFVLHGTRRRFGSYSIFVMMVPYCMIHFGKPMPETFGAIGAGIVLGFMSLKTRSIWLGAVIHVAVALSMDLLALWQTGFLS